MNEFVQLFVYLGLPKTDASRLFDVIDLNYDDSISYEEFLDWIMFGGKSSYVAGDMSMLTVSKEAAKLVRHHGETEAIEYKDPDGMYCSVNTSVRAIMLCEQCHRYFSQAGFDQFHKNAEMREHTTRLLPPPKDGSTQKSTHREMALKLIDENSSDQSLFKSLEAELKKQFRVYDLDRDGSIQKGEMVAIALSMAKYVGAEQNKDQAEREVHKLFRTMDTNRDGSVQLSEFLGALVKDAIDPTSPNYGPETAAKKAAQFTAALSAAMKEAGLLR